MWVALLVASLALVLASLAQARAAGPPVLALLSAVHLQPQGRAYRSSFHPSLLDDLNLQAYLVDLCQIIPALTLTSIRKSLLVVPYGQVAWSFRSRHAQRLPYWCRCRSEVQGIVSLHFSLLCKIVQFTRCVYA